MRGPDPQRPQPARLGGLRGRPGRLPGAGAVRPVSGMGLPAHRAHRPRGRARRDPSGPRRAPGRGPRRLPDPHPRRRPHPRRPGRGGPRPGSPAGPARPGTAAPRRLRGPARPAVPAARQPRRPDRRTGGARPREHGAAARSRPELLRSHGAADDRARRPLRTRRRRHPDVSAVGTRAPAPCGLPARHPLPGARRQREGPARPPSAAAAHPGRDSRLPRARRFR